MRAALSFAILVGSADASLADEGAGEPRIPHPETMTQRHIDPSGCVYVRAHLDGQVIWVQTEETSESCAAARSRPPLPPTESVTAEL